MEHPNKKQPKDYSLLAESHGLRWLGSMPKSTKDKTSWQCSKGHNWETSFGSILRGRGCHFCSPLLKANKMNLKSDSYESIARSKGYTWVGPLPTNRRINTSWICSNNHTFESSYALLHSGHGCQKCARENASSKMRLTQLDYDKVAKQFHITHLGPLPSSAQRKTSWQCAHGHKWLAPICWIQQGQGCKRCAAEKNSKAGLVIPEELLAIASKFNYTWIGPTVKDKGTATGWRCQKGHEWSTTYLGISKRWGCPECGGSRKSKKRAKLLAEDYHAIAASRGFIWLGQTVTNSLTKTEWQCARGHSWQATYGKISTGRGCPNCGIASSAAARSHKSEDYEALAASRGFIWLRSEPTPRSNKGKTRWSCPKGHIWLSSYGKIQAGRSCPACSQHRVAESQRLLESDYIELAAKRGFSWAGPRPTNRHGKSWWGCPEGHTWDASYSNILRERGCPACGRESMKSLMRLKDSDYEEFAASRGWKWIGPSVPNVVTKTNWHCSKMHIVSSALAWLKGGNGCPACSDMVNGAKVSGIQRELAEILKGSLNVPAGAYSIDVAVHVGSTKIAVEYDSWYYHGDRLENDRKKTRLLLDLGWKVFRIRSNTLLPEEEILHAALQSLVEGKRKVYILTLDDWRIGPTFKQQRFLATTPESASVAETC